MFQYQQRPQFNINLAQAKNQSKEWPVQSPPVTSPESPSLQGIQKSSRKIRNVNLFSAYPKAQQEDQECLISLSCTFSPVGLWTAQGLQTGLDTPSPERGRELLGLEKGHWRSSCLARATPRWLPSTFSMVLVHSLSVPHRAVPAQPEHPPRWLNCKKHKI